MANISSVGVGNDIPQTSTPKKRSTLNAAATGAMGGLAASVAVDTFSMAYKAKQYAKAAKDEGKNISFKKAFGEVFDYMKKFGNVEVKDGVLEAKQLPIKGKALLAISTASTMAMGALVGVVANHFDKSKKAE